MLFIQILNLLYISKFTFCNFIYLIPNLYFTNWFVISTILFSVGLTGLIFSNGNFLIFLIKVELMSLGINLFFLASSIYFYDIDGILFSLLIFGIIASESALGLSLFFSYFLSVNKGKIKENGYVKKSRTDDILLITYD
jgi:NADH:ubiquinone oxidoreductase subunit 11 or 4L (chain K)